MFTCLCRTKALNVVDFLDDELSVEIVKRVATSSPTLFFYTQSIRCATSCEACDQALPIFPLSTLDSSSLRLQRTVPQKHAFSPPWRVSLVPCTKCGRPLPGFLVGCAGTIPLEGQIGDCDKMGSDRCECDFTRVAPKSDSPGFFTKLLTNSKTHPGAGVRH